jgi:peptidoglycan hydrolase-like protein with peptidoglycan-binding domain
MEAGPGDSYPHLVSEINLGDSSEQVRRWQERMVELGLNLSITGIFDTESEGCCRDFQDSRSLDATGIVDMQTWDASFG